MSSKKYKKKEEGRGRKMKDIRWLVKAEEEKRKKVNKTGESDVQIELVSEQENKKEGRKD